MVEQAQRVRWQFLFPRQMVRELALMRKKFGAPGVVSLKRKAASEMSVLLSGTPRLIFAF